MEEKKIKEALWRKAFIFTTETSNNMFKNLNPCLPTAASPITHGVIESHCVFRPTGSWVPKAH